MGQISGVFLGSAFGNGVGVLGILVSLFLFYLQLKNQVDAYKERIRVANAELIFGVIKRVAVERKVIREKQYDSLRSAYQFAVGKKAKLIQFSLALSCAFKEILSNPFLDSHQRQEIIDLIEISSESAEQVGPIADIKQAFEILEGIESGPALAAAVLSLAIGLATAFVAGQIARQVQVAQLSATLWGGVFLLGLAFAAFSFVPSRTWRRRQSRNVSSIDLAALKDIETGR